MLAILGERVYGVSGEDLPESSAACCAAAGLTVAVAESCTGGLVGKRLTDVPGSSDYFLGGVTAYDNRVKTEVLGVPAGMLAAARRRQRRGGRGAWPRACAGCSAPIARCPPPG